MTNESSNCCIIDAVCGIDTASPQISRYTDSFNQIKFLLKKDLSQYTIMIITDIGGYVQIIPTDGETLIAGTDENGDTTLLWNIGSEITASSGAVIYQISAYKSNDGEAESIWYSKEGRLLVSESIDTTTHSAAIIGSHPNLITKLILHITEFASKLDSKVDKIPGMGLSSQDFTSTEKLKLADIMDNAAPNVQSDWNETNYFSDSYIRNKPDISQIENSFNTQIDETKGLVGQLITETDIHRNNEEVNIKHLTDAEKEAVGNLKSVATSGSYEDLSDKPFIPVIDQSIKLNSANAAQSHAVAIAIKNVNTEIEKTNTIVDRIVNGNEPANYANRAVSDIRGRQIDTYYAPLSYVRPAPVDTLPTTLSANTAYHLCNFYPNLTLSFPTDANNGDVIYVSFWNASPAINLTVDTSNTTDIDLVPETNTGYEIYAKFDGVLGKWIVKYSEYDLKI
ncbi:MAG: hypothetical protein II998_02705 [Clostridia bacterium]|nr:hypothetical protein [Clostridia bacterium]